MSGLTLYVVVAFFYFVLLFETGSVYVAQDGLEFMMLQLQLPESSDYKHVPPLSSNLQIFFSFLFYISVKSTYKISPALNFIQLIYPYS
jgi:hypothetical protein